MPEYIPDYNDLHAEHEAREERRLRKYPKCNCCSEPITSDYLFNIRGTLFCHECLVDNFREDTDAYINY